MCNSLTLNFTYLWPLFLLLQGILEFRAEGDMVCVVQHDAHHLTGHVLEPAYCYHLTELERK